MTLTGAQMLVLLVALGGAVGSVARYLIGTAIQRGAGGGFPVGTLVINVTGSLLIGFILKSTLDATTVPATTRALLATGVCGGYTTFSAFAFETATLMERGDLRSAFAYATLSVVLSVAGTFGGMALAKQLS